MGLWRDSDREQPSQPGEVDAFCATLIESASVDRPSVSGLSRTARRLGVPLAAVGAAIGTDLIARSAAAAEGLGAAAASGGVGAGGASAAGTALADAVASSVGSAAAVAGAAGSAVGGGVSGTAAVGGAAVAAGTVATAAIGTGTLATAAVGTGTAAASGWGASSALLLVVKAVGAGALAGAIGIGAVKVADRVDFSDGGWFGSRSGAEHSQSLAQPEHAPSSGHLSRPDVPRTFGAVQGELAVLGGLAAPAVGDPMNPAAAGTEGAGAGGPGNPGSIQGSPDTQPALGSNPAAKEGVANASSVGRTVLQPHGGDDLRGSPELQGNSGVRETTEVPGSLAMRGVGELPSASAGSFPEQVGGAAGSAARVPAVPPEASDAPSALRVELAILNQVRGLLQQGRGADGLRALDQYQVRFPSGSLGAEALLLRVEALALAGRRDEATRAAERMIERFPRSPHRARLQELGLLPAR